MNAKLAPTPPTRLLHAAGGPYRVGVAAQPQLGTQGASQQRCRGAGERRNILNPRRPPNRTAPNNELWGAVRKPPRARPNPTRNFNQKPLHKSRVPVL